MDEVTVLVDDVQMFKMEQLGLEDADQEETVQRLFDNALDQLYRQYQEQQREEYTTAGDENSDDTE